jgi:uncharacterized protein with von Willebrand factor type A (vWA) domain
VYLDDSGSMQGKNLKAAKIAFNSIMPKFENVPTRIVLFGSSKTELVQRTAKVNSELMKADAWKGFSGGTYMWHMIGNCFSEKNG